VEASILTSTKKILGLTEDDESFDKDIITLFNCTISTLTQIGVGPANGFFIEDSSTEWAEFIGDDNVLNMVRSYVFLKVRMLFDPPTTSFMIEAMNKQIEEYEFRISSHREWMLDPVDPKITREEANRGYHGDYGYPVF